MLIPRLRQAVFILTAKPRFPTIPKTLNPVKINTRPVPQVALKRNFVEVPRRNYKNLTNCSQGCAGENMDIVVTQDL